MAHRKQSWQLSTTRQLIVLLIVLLSSYNAIAQVNNRNILVELVANTSDQDALLHVRVPRGQTIDEATLSQGEAVITLSTDVITLEQTQFIVLDSSDAMINLQAVVQSNMPRLWQTGEQSTGLLFFDRETSFLRPTTRTEDIDNFLSDYSVNSGAPACLSTALTALNDLNRDYDRSWRILLVTTGDFSGVANCDTQTFATAPAPVDVIALTAEIAPELQDLIDRSGGQFYTANLRSIEARTNDVLTQWGQPTYALDGNIPDTWDITAPFELDIALSNGTEENLTLSFRDYNVPLPATPTPQPTITASPTSEATTVASIEATEPSVDVSATAIPEPTTATNNLLENDGVAILLIIGAILFVVGAVVLALALSRVRRTPTTDIPIGNPNFYETLSASEPQVSDSQSSTRIREKDIVSSEYNPDPDTRIANFDDTQIVMDDVSRQEDHDNLLVTQVLTDDRFRIMMEQSKNNDEIIGWMRLIIEGDDTHQDYELTQRGALIGRSLECDIQITGDRAISRKHARLDVRNNKQVTVSRLSAVNPVVIGGVQISNRHPLEPNDVIHLSDETRLIFIARQSDDDDNDEA